MYKPKNVSYPKFSPEYLISSWFWSGRLQPASGTWGTLAAMPLWIFLFKFTSFYVVAAVIIALFFAGAWAVNKIEKHCGRKNSHDASVFVIDEVIGVGITAIPLYPLFIDVPLSQQWVWWIVAFLIFRIFDIIKPPPAWWAETKLYNSWGVMLDDVIAGIYASIIVLALIMGVGTATLCTIEGPCLGTLAELIFYELVFLIPLGTVYAILILPSLYFRWKKRKKTNKF